VLDFVDRHRTAQTFERGQRLFEAGEAGEAGGIFKVNDNPPFAGGFSWIVPTMSNQGHELSARPAVS
jgi:hypothetical protein